MRVKSVHCVDFKGITEVVELRQCNVIVGPNGVGKTARALALTFAVTGRTPLGDRPEATFKLAGPNGCSVGIALDDGFTWRRRLHIDRHTHALSMALDIPTQGRLGVRAAEKALERHVGSFAPMFDLGAFLDLSDENRRAFVLRLCAGAAEAGECDAEELANRIYANVHDVVAAGKATGIRPLEPALTPIIESLKPVLVGDLPTALGAAIETVRDLTNASKADHRRATEAARKLTENKAARDTVAGSVESLTEKRTAMVREREQIIAQLGTQEGRDSARKASRAKMAECEQVIAAETPQLASQVAASALGGDANAAHNKRARAAELRDTVTIPDLSDLETAKTQAVVAFDAAVAEHASAEGHVVALEAMNSELAARLEAAHDSPWRKVEGFLATLKPAMDLVAVRKAQGWEQTQTEVAAAWAELHELVTLHLPPENEVEGVKEAWAEAKATHEQAFKAKAVSAARSEECKAAADTARVALDEAFEKRAAVANDVKDNFVQAEELEGQANQILERLNGIAELERTISQWVKWRLEHAEELSKLDAEGGHVNVGLLTQQRDGLQHTIATLDEQIKAKEHYATLDAELLKCVASAESALARHEMCKVVATAIRDLREELMAELVQPLLDGINKFLAIACPGHEAYCSLMASRRFTSRAACSASIQSMAAVSSPYVLSESASKSRATLVNDKDRPVFELGWNDGQRRVPLPALSGGETALFCCGLAYALVSLADTPLKLLLLEAGELDAANLRRVLCALADLRGNLSNIIVTTHLDITAPDAAWNVVRLTNEHPEPRDHTPAPMETHHAVDTGATASG